MPPEYVYGEEITAGYQSPAEILEILENPWNVFIMEVACLRDYFVDHAVKSSDSKAGNEFLTMVNYS